jgi:hypothetical protein
MVTPEEIEKEINDNLERYVDSLEPKTHCCECERGELHTVHIQYDNCKCRKPYKYRRFLDEDG